MWFGTFVNFFRFNRTSKIGATTMGENGMVLNGSVISVLTRKVGSSVLQTEGCGLGLKKSKTCMFCILRKIYFRGEKTLPTPGYPLNQFVYYTHPVPNEQVLVQWTGKNVTVTGRHFSKSSELSCRVVMGWDTLTRWMSSTSVVCVLPGAEGRRGGTHVNTEPSC